MAQPILGTSTVDVSSATNTTRTFSHTVASGEELLIIRASFRGSSATPSGISFTFNGVACTLVPSASASTSSGRMITEIHYLVNPSVGTYNVVANWTATANWIITVQGVTNSNVAPTGGNSNFATDTTPTVTITSQTNELVIDSVVTNAGVTLTVGAGQTQGTNTETATGSSDLRAATSRENGASSVTMSWTRSASGTWASVGCSLVEKVTSASNGGAWFAFAGS